ncbi:hypothetical protein A7U60_g2535 [Sanghuangporus baumii]|uniref:Ricin B lectin domain-containing protein n=1 Tax=Sanghuangporus baumii TaxID=108892 RepID=A0A9Q5I2A9_SANBA|nr:hypothetical protein A7U60_g2535 [Sanghuangporus baumii]
MQLSAKSSSDTISPSPPQSSMGQNTESKIVSNGVSSILEPGVYVMRNLRSDSVIDLSGGDSKSIIGFPRHGFENQQWEFGILGDGWYIRSAHSGAYLNIEKGLGDGFPVIANSYPAAWAVENQPGEGHNVFRISWPNTPYSFDLDNGDPTPGTKVPLFFFSMFPIFFSIGNDKVNLWSKISGARHQLWQLQRCVEKDRKVSEVATVTETNTPETTTTSTTTTTITTVTTTTVVTRRNGLIVAEGFE